MGGRSSPNQGSWRGTRRASPDWGLCWRRGRGPRVPAPGRAVPVTLPKRLHRGARAQPRGAGRDHHVQGPHGAAEGGGTPELHVPIRPPRPSCPGHRPPAGSIPQPCRAPGPEAAALHGGTAAARGPWVAPGASGATAVGPAHGQVQGVLGGGRTPRLRQPLHPSLPAASEL
uniref:Putative collagen homolog protein-b n=1 Tax=Homo sapiens TaxID=9606 RepID=O00486_HUMAN|nr:putative collagen homolog protein-b [Homo sapiens]